MGQGQSKVWQVTHDLPHFDGDFYWQIWGDKDGLSPAQTQAVAKLFQNTATIKAQATPAIVDFLTPLDFLLPKELVLTQDNVWQFLTADYSEIRENAEIAIGFLTAWDDEHLVCVKVRNGEFFEVNTE